MEHVWSAFIWVRAVCSACGKERTVRAESRRLKVGGKSEFETTPLGAQKWRPVSPCSCGNALTARMREINVTVAPEVSCKGSCHSAKGIDCMCSCGGRNHGVRAS